MDQTRCPKQLTPYQRIIWAFGYLVCVLFCFWAALSSGCPALSPSESPVADAAPVEKTLGPAASLVDHHAWISVASDVDPYAAKRPVKINCIPIAGFGFESINEEDSLQVRTEFCDYLTVQQPLLLAVAAGDLLRLRLWHYQLTQHDQASQAELSISLGRKEVWQETLMIPVTRGKLLLAEWHAQKAYAKGEPIFFHLRNHGANSYHLIEISVRKPID